MIKRDAYLNRFVSCMGNDSVKVITGIRRCGKSYLMNTIFYDYLLSSGVEASHIIRFAFDSASDLEKIGEDLIEIQIHGKKVDYHKFMNYIKESISAEGQYYLLLDEIQLLDAFEFVLNGYLAMGNMDIYVTGSNSKFLSSDVITEFRGRGDEIHILPLAFSEYYGYLGGDMERRLEEYMTFGGLPRCVLAKNEEEKMAYLAAQLEKTYLKDVIDRNKIKNTEALSELFDILASGISAPTNPSKLEKRFQSEKKISLSADSIGKYIGCLKEAFILDRAVRYDVRGKAYIGTPYKLYFEDLGLPNAKLNFRQVEFTHLMENVIYNELRFRGYRVDTGMVEIREGSSRKQLEVDFVANKGSRRYYIQSVYDIHDEEKFVQETRSLDNIADSFKKIIVIDRPIVARYTDKGYLMLSLSEFLLNQDSLDM